MECRGCHAGSGGRRLSGSGGVGMEERAHAQPDQGLSTEIPRGGAPEQRAQHPHPKTEERL